MKDVPIFRMFFFATCLLQAISPFCATLLWSQTSAEPIIDMHLHAKRAQMTSGLQQASCPDEGPTENPRETAQDSRDQRRAEKQCPLAHDAESNRGRRSSDSQ